MDRPCWLKAYYFVGNSNGVTNVLQMHREMITMCLLAKTLVIFHHRVLFCLILIIFLVVFFYRSLVVVFHLHKSHAIFFFFITKHGVYGFCFWRGVFCTVPLDFQCEVFALFFRTAPFWYAKNNNVAKKNPITCITCITGE